MADTGEPFMIMFPCFTIMNKACTGGVVLPQEEGGNACVIFTDDDLMRDFRARHKFLGPTIRFDWDHELFFYLRALPPAVNLVGFDPGRVSVTTFKVKELIAFLWKRMNETEPGE